MCEYEPPLNLLVSIVVGTFGVNESAPCVNEPPLNLVVSILVGTFGVNESVPCVNEPPLNLLVLIVVGTLGVKLSSPCVKLPPVKAPCVNEPEPAAVTFGIEVAAVALIGTSIFSNAQLDAEPALVTFGIETEVVVILLAVVVDSWTPMTDVVLA